MHKTLGIQFAHPMTKLSPLLHTLITPLGAMHCLLHIRSGKLESSQSICLGFGFFLPLCFRFFFLLQDTCTFLFYPHLENMGGVNFCTIVWLGSTSVMEKSGLFDCYTDARLQISNHRWLEMHERINTFL